VYARQNEMARRKRAIEYDFPLVRGCLRGIAPGAAEGDAAACLESWKVREAAIRMAEAPARKKSPALCDHPDRKRSSRSAVERLPGREPGWPGVKRPSASPKPWRETRDRPAAVATTQASGYSVYRPAATTCRAICRPSAMVSAGSCLASRRTIAIWVRNMSPSATAATTFLAASSTVATALAA